MEEMQAKVEQSLRKRFKKELFNNFCKAIDEYNLIQAGDKIAVCISGGKDSMLMAKLFQELQLRWTYRENRIKKNEIFRLRNQDCSAQNDKENNEIENNTQNDIKNIQCNNNQTKTNVRVRGSISTTKDETKNQGFELVFLVMDPGYNKANREMIEQNAKQLGVPITIFETDIFNSVVNVEKSPCYLCARMRRGYLYSKAKELGCNKIALGHHYNDVIETILMGMLFSGQFQTMLPKLNSTNFEGMQLIRPMYLIKEKDILHWRDYCGLKFLQCACRFTEQTNYSTCTQTDIFENDFDFKKNLKMLNIKNEKTICNKKSNNVDVCNSKVNLINSNIKKDINKNLKDETVKNVKENEIEQANLTKEQTSMRKFTKQLIAKLNELYPQIETNIFKSVENVNLSTLISYKDKHGTHSFKDNF